LKHPGALVTAPEFFILAGLAYLLSATAASMDPLMAGLNEKVSVSPLAFLVFLFGLFSFYLGLKTHKKALRLGYAPIIIALPAGVMAAYFILGLNPAFALAINLFAIMLSLILLFSRIRYDYLFAAGASLFWLNLLLNGIPLLQMERHAELFSFVNPLFVTGFFFMLYSSARLYPKRRCFWMFLVFSAFLSTYRIYAGIAFMAWMLLELKNPGLGKRMPLKSAALIAGVFAFAAIFIFLGYSIMAGSHGSWILNPVRTLEYRLALTMGVFNDIVGLSFPAGRTFGGSLTMEATGFTCKELYGCTERITSTAFGEAMLDFGLLGVFAVSWLIAVVLGNLYRKDYALYAMLFASLIAAMDVGINIFLLLEYIYLGWARMAIEWEV